MALAPGDYTVRVMLSRDLPGVRQIDAGAVAVVAIQASSVTVTVDSGIR